MWNIVKSETGKKEKKKEGGGGTEKKTSLNINGQLIQNQQTNSNSCNDYFSTTAEKLIGANQIDIMSQ
jgi:hypothetical protein